MERKSEISNWSESQVKLTLKDLMVLGQAITGGIKDFMEKKRREAEVLIKN